MSDRAESFIALTRRDLELARLVSTRDPGNAAFHLQQAAEKLAKAVLDVEGIPSGVTHQIGALAALLPADHVLRPDLAAFDRFSAYATSTRYPLPGGGLPRLPTKDFLAVGIREVASLVDEIDDYRRERRTGAKPR
ncbi:HEPN domain-containing protein [Bradyrhizobium yuanmingense]|uniref:HEPN domain-containing protein n=1 Tax=Bradyrhizobium yuanmingense TaxID=108015 RepID=UPI0023B942FD|nr:HEPN domain-containing protein [Bradyrhizobium yuanmingense]MDF0498250.1 HEPN domain-containing protein [Bradyrhizobium yuanmingense]